MDAKPPPHSGVPWGAAPLVGVLSRRAAGQRRSHEQTMSFLRHKAQNAVQGLNRRQARAHRQQRDPAAATATCTAGDASPATIAALRLHSTSSPSAARAATSASAPASVRRSRSTHAMPQSGRTDRHAPPLPCRHARGALQNQRWAQQQLYLQQQQHHHQQEHQHQHHHQHHHQEHPRHLQRPRSSGTLRRASGASGGSRHRHQRRRSRRNNVGGVASHAFRPGRSLDTTAASSSTGHLMHHARSVTLEMSTWLWPADESVVLPSAASLLPGGEGDVEVEGGGALGSDLLHHTWAAGDRPASSPSSLAPHAWASTTTATAAASNVSGGIFSQSMSAPASRRVSRVATAHAASAVRRPHTTSGSRPRTNPTTPPATRRRSAMTLGRRSAKRRRQQRHAAAGNRFGLARTRHVPEPVGLSEGGALWEADAVVAQRLAAKQAERRRQRELREQAERRERQRHALATSYMSAAMAKTGPPSAVAAAKRAAASEAATAAAVAAAAAAASVRQEGGAAAFDGAPGHHRPWRGESFRGLQVDTGETFASPSAAYHHDSEAGAARLLGLLGPSHQPHFDHASHGAFHGASPQAGSPGGRHAMAFSSTHHQEDGEGLGGGGGGGGGGGVGGRPWADAAGTRKGHRGGAGVARQRRQSERSGAWSTRSRSSGTRTPVLRKTPRSQAYMLQHQPLTQQPPHDTLQHILEKGESSAHLDVDASHDDDAHDKAHATADEDGVSLRPGFRLHRARRRGASSGDVGSSSSCSSCSTCSTCSTCSFLSCSSSSSSCASSDEDTGAAMDDDAARAGRGSSSPSSTDDDDHHPRHRRSHRAATSSSAAAGAGAAGGAGLGDGAAPPSVVRGSGPRLRRRPAEAAAADYTGTGAGGRDATAGDAAGVGGVGARHHSRSQRSLRHGQQGHRPSHHGRDSGRGKKRDRSRGGSSRSRSRSRSRHGGRRGKHSKHKKQHKKGKRRHKQVDASEDGGQGQRVDKPHKRRRRHHHHHDKQKHDGKEKHKKRYKKKRKKSKKRKRKKSKKRKKRQRRHAQSLGNGYGQGTSGKSLEVSQPGHDTAERNSKVMMEELAQRLRATDVDMGWSLARQQQEQRAKGVLALLSRPSKEALALNLQPLLEERERKWRHNLALAAVGRASHADDDGALLQQRRRGARGGFQSGLDDDDDTDGDGWLHLLAELDMPVLPHERVVAPPAGVDGGGMAGDPSASAGGGGNRDGCAGGGQGDDDDAVVHGSVGAEQAGAVGTATASGHPALTAGDAGAAATAGAAAPVPALAPAAPTEPPEAVYKHYRDGATSARHQFSAAHTPPEDEAIVEEAPTTTDEDARFAVAAAVIAAGHDAAAGGGERAGKALAAALALPSSTDDGGATTDSVDAAGNASSEAASTTTPTTATTATTTAAPTTATPTAAAAAMAGGERGDEGHGGASTAPQPLEFNGWDQAVEGEVGATAGLVWWDGPAPTHHPGRSLTARGMGRFVGILEPEPAEERLVLAFATAALRGNGPRDWLREAMAAEKKIREQQHQRVVVDRKQAALEDARLKALEELEVREQERAEAEEAAAKARRRAEEELCALEARRKAALGGKLLAQRRAQAAAKRRAIEEAKRRREARRVARELAREKREREAMHDAEWDQQRQMWWGSESDRNSGNWRTVRVFISSTFRDMHGEVCLVGCVSVRVCVCVCCCCCPFPLGWIP